MHIQIFQYIQQQKHKNYAACIQLCWSLFMVIIYTLKKHSYVGNDLPWTTINYNVQNNYTKHMLPPECHK